MRAMILDQPGRPLRAGTLPDPEPGPGQVRLRVRACGICRTDLHVADGELPGPRLPLVLGHEIVATVTDAPAGSRFRPGDRVGVPWLGWTCGVCPYCRSGRENLCDRARFTGHQIDGGYAELRLQRMAELSYSHGIPPVFRVTPLTPPEIVEVLDGLQWEEFEPSLVMAMEMPDVDFPVESTVRYFDPTDPECMPPAERRDEVASILARGILRLHGRVANIDDTGEIAENSRRTCLDLPPESRPDPTTG